VNVKKDEVENKVIVAHYWLIYWFIG